MPDCYNGLSPSKAGISFPLQPGGLFSIFGGLYMVKGGGPYMV